MKKYLINSKSLDSGSIGRIYWL